MYLTSEKTLHPWTLKADSTVRFPQTFYCSFQNARTGPIDPPCILKRERPRGRTGYLRCGDVVKRVDVRRGFCFVFVARARSPTHRGTAAAAVAAIGNITVIRIGLGKTRQKGKKGPPTDCDGDCDYGSLHAQKKEGRNDGRGRGRGKAAEVSFSESLAWITEIDLAQKKGNLSLAERSRTAAVFCWFIVGGSGARQGRGAGKGGREHAIKVRSRYADDCFHSVLFHAVQLTP